MSESPKEIFLANSQGWKEEAEAVIKDVKDQVKEIVISNKLESSDSQIYLNITTMEDQKITVELSGQGFCIVCKHCYDTVEDESNESTDYYETPYSLLDHISPGYRKAFGDNLEKALRKLSQEQSKEQSKD